LQIRWLESDWFDALRMERFDMLLCNPPYVRSEDSHMQSLRYEPGIALDGGSDGLAAIRRVMARARSCMTQDAVLIIEHGFDQSGAVAAIAADCGLTVSELRRDLAGLPRVSIMRARQ
jgi:release factor glutamine methyltransferase